MLERRRSCGGTSDRFLNVAALAAVLTETLANTFRLEKAFFFNQLPRKMTALKFNALVIESEF